MAWWYSGEINVAIKFIADNIEASEVIGWGFREVVGNGQSFCAPMDAAIHNNKMHATPKVGRVI